MMIHVSRGDPGYLLLKFPYDERVLALVKRIPGREWRKRDRAWQIPAEHDTLTTLERMTPPGWSVFTPVDVRQELERARTLAATAAQVARDGDAAVDFDFLTEPYAHQRAGFAFLRSLGSGGLLWEMGTGKTKTAIDYAESLADDWLTSPHDREFRVLILCPNSVRHTVWAPEIEKHAGHQDYVVLDGSGHKRARLVGTARYTIANVEALSGGFAADTLVRTHWNLVICDESSRFKGHNTNRTKRLMKMKADHRLIMTGTPMPNTPQDLWSQLSFVKPGIFGSWWSFRERFLSLDWFGNVRGIKQGMEQEFAAKVESVSYRVLKSEVLDLPPKVYMDRVVGMSPTQQQAYDTMVNELRMEIPESGDQVFAASVLTQLLRLTQITAGLIGERESYAWDDTNPKLHELDGLLREELASEQVVVFGLYQRELEELARRYTTPTDNIPHGIKHWPPIIYGPTPTDVRTSLINEFQQGSRRLLFCQIRTGGIGLNLTAAQTAIYYTRSWSLEDYLQSQDRLHRIGQTGTVSIIHLVTDKSVDQDIAKALATKQTTADLITGDALRRLRASILKGDA